MDGPFAGCTIEGGLEIVWALDRQGVQRDSRRPCGGLRGTKLDFADEALKAQPRRCREACTSGTNSPYGHPL